jgi:hypothetical protein
LLGALISSSLLVSAALSAGSGSAAPLGPTFKRIDTIGVGPTPSYGMVRTPNGVLHLLFQATAPGSSSANGLAARSISPGGTVGAQSAALTGWQPGVPGLTDTPGGALQAVFGAISPAPGSVSAMWGIGSTNGGSSWVAPAGIGAGGADEAHAYGADYTMQRSGTTPVVIMSVAGLVTVQQGLGPGSPVTQVTTGADDFAADANSAVDGASHEVVASWQSLAGSGGTFIQGVAPAVGPAQKVPGRPSTQLVIAGRDTGPGVFGAYTSDGKHVSLLRYPGGSVPVGAKAGVSAKVLGVATGPAGRIWVMWGDEDGGLVVTRSNKAVTKFEPLQRVDPHAFTLYRLGGDGRLGPLDLLVDMIPDVGKSYGPPGTFYGRVRPELSAAATLSAVKNGKGTVIARKLTVVVTDAGDKVAGAQVSASGKSGKTAGNGTVTLVLPAAASSTAVTVSAPGYKTLTTKA